MGWATLRPFFEINGVTGFWGPYLDGQKYMGFSLGLVSPRNKLELNHLTCKTPLKTNMVHLKMGGPLGRGDSELGNHHFRFQPLLVGG